MINSGDNNYNMETIYQKPKPVQLKGCNGCIFDTTTAEDKLGIICKLTGEDCEDGSHYEQGQKIAAPSSDIFINNTQQ